MINIDNDEILMTDVIEHCIKVKNFSYAYIQKTFEMPYALAGRLLDACKEAGVIVGDCSQKYITVSEYKKNKKGIVKVLIKNGLF